MKKYIIIAFLVFFASFLHSQTISLTFTGNETCSYVEFDSVKISNLNHNYDTILHFPDTVLSMQVSNIDNLKKSNDYFSLSQNYPNPFQERTKIEINVIEEDNFMLGLFDISGKLLTSCDKRLGKGLHTFSVSGQNSGSYFFTVKSHSYSQTIKLIQTKSCSFANPNIQHLGSDFTKSFTVKSFSEQTSFSFNSGDNLSITGYYNDYIYVIDDSPTESTIYNLDFAHPVCPPEFTDSRDGVIYEAIKINCQCWMAENLRFLPAVSGVSEGSSTKAHYYVYDYNGTSIATATSRENYKTYGVLYNWNAAMQGLVHSQGNAQGVCPDGWRLPNDEDWKTLEVSLGMSEHETNNIGYRGTNEGSKLAGKLHLWFSGYVTANEGFGASEFNAVPGGGRYFTNIFDYLRSTAIYWSATKSGDNNAWIRSISTHYSSGVYRNTSNIENGFSARCIKK